MVDNRIKIFNNPLNLPRNLYPTCVYFLRS